MDQYIDDCTDTLERKATLLSTIGNKNRLHILHLLAGGEMCVGEIAEKLEISQSAVSQHLAILRGEEMVTVRRACQTRYYSLKPLAARIVLDVLVDIFESQLRSCPGKTPYVDGSAARLDTWDR